MGELERIAQQQLGEIARDLEAIRFCLLGVHASLPAEPAGEPSFDLGEDMEPALFLRAVIETVLEDRLEPLIRDLQAAVRRMKETA